MTSTNQQSSKPPSLLPSRPAKSAKLWLAAGALVLVIWVGSIVATGQGINLWPNVKWNFTNSGQFGDSFGPLSAFMAAAAATAAILAWSSQREELERAKRADEENRLTALIARDENTLFQMISLLRQIVSGLDIHLSSGKVKTGHDAIGHIVGRVLQGNDEATRESYRTVFSRYRNDVAHYLRLSYNIFSFISSSNLSDKYFYARMVRALLSDAELSLIALNCVYGQGQEKYKPLVEKYSLLNNISEEMKTSFYLTTQFEFSAFHRTGAEV